jgi:hypothetical protein
MCRHCLLLLLLLLLPCCSLQWWWAEQQEHQLVAVSPVLDSLRCVHHPQH